MTMTKQTDVVKEKITMPMNNIDIMKYMPHRYPFLLIDRVTHFTPFKSITVIKNVTLNEQFFLGHFPTYPVMPGVLIIEAMAQASGLLLILSNNGRQNDELYFFASIEKAKFKKQVIPGDTLRFDVEYKKGMRGVTKYSAVAYVENNIVAQAEITLAKNNI